MESLAFIVARTSTHSSPQWLVPVFGRRSCTETQPERSTSTGDFRAIAHPGLMSQSWRFLAFEVGIVSCKQKALEALSIAKNIAWNPLRFRVNEIEESIVAYCLGPYCVLSFESFALLRAKGYQAHRLVDGFPEWKAAGFEVELPA